MMKPYAYRLTPDEPAQGQPQIPGQNTENEIVRNTDPESAGDTSLEIPSDAQVESRRPESMGAPASRPAMPGASRSIKLDLAQIDPHLIAFCDSDPSAMLQYKRLVVSLISLATPLRSKRILIASAKHGEGRTTVALNLAGALAAAKQRVLAIDSDLTRPSMLRLLGTEVHTGLEDGLAVGLPLERIIVKLLPFGFSLLAARSHSERSVGLLASPVLRADLEFLEPYYDFILFDSPPLLESPDAQLIRNLVDTSLLVIRPDMNSAAEMANALRMFRKEDLLGVVLNRCVPGDD